MRRQGVKVLTQSSLFVSTYFFSRPSFLFPLLHALLLIIVFFSSLSLIASNDENDILERRDVQTILFGEGVSYWDFKPQKRVFRSELVGNHCALLVSAYYLNQMKSFLKSEWGASYELVGQKHRTALKGVFLLNWDRHLIRPFVGVDGGGYVAPKEERKFFAHGLVGADIQWTKRFGISLREVWTFPHRTVHWGHRVNMRFQNAIFELALYWQI